LAITLFASDAVIVGWISGPEEVAMLQATQPLASGNLIIFYALIPLFIPTASRLFAGGDRAKGEQLYATCSLWVAVFTFPVAALTIGCAATLTETLFGQRYADAAVILAIMSVGQYMLAVFGLGGLTLKAHGVLRSLGVANVVVTAINLGVNIVLVQHLGAFGAAVGTTLTICLLTLVKFFIVRRELGISPVDRRLARALLQVVALTGTLLFINVALRPGLGIDIVLVVLASLLLLWTSRRDLALLRVFPEAARVPLLRVLFRAP
jgi:O-antigen/teichoic acid export membrane protein